MQLLQQRHDRGVAHRVRVEVGVRDLPEFDVQLGAQPRQELRRARLAQQADQGERHVAADAQLGIPPAQAGVPVQRPDEVDQGMGALEHGVLRCLPHMI